MYLLIFINNVSRDAFVNHFGENGWSWVAVLLGSLLCQSHLIALGAQRSLVGFLWVDTQKCDMDRNNHRCDYSCSMQTHMNGEKNDKSDQEVQ